MESGNKRSVDEYAANFFACVFVIAIGAAIYFLLELFGPGGTWNNLLIALIVAGWSRWVANQLWQSARHLESKLETAPDTTLDHRELFNFAKQAHRETTENQETWPIVEAYVALLKKTEPKPFCIRDAAQLPYPKRAIKHAIIKTMRGTRDPQFRKDLKTAYLLLADWQHNVEQAVLGLDITTAADRQQNQSGLATSDDTNAALVKWTPIIMQEMTRLRAELDTLDEAED